MSNLLKRLARLFSKSAAERELDDELTFHVERRTEELLLQGLSETEAQRRALVELGGLTQVKEEVRTGRAGVWLETLGQDIRYGGRMLRKNPGFTTIAVLTLALGIGANTAVFSLLDAALLKRLQVREPERLVLLDWIAGRNIDFLTSIDGTYQTNEQGQGWSTSFSVPVFEELRNQNQVLDSVFAFAELDRINAMADGETSIAYGQLVSSEYFTGLGVSAWRGRMLGLADFDAAAEPAAVISYRYWQSRFGGDGSAIGKRVVLNGTAVTLVGVTPPGFEGAMQVGFSPDITLPLPLDDRMQLEKGRAADPTNWWVRVMGRLKPGVTREQALANLAPIFHGVVTHNRAPNATWDIPELRVHDGSRGLEDVRARYAEPLYLLLGGVVLVLLVACANVATLMLMRGEQRRKEISMRMALGAQRARLFRQVLVESVLLSVGGGAAGWVLAVWGRNLIVAALPLGAGHTAPEPVLDGRVLLFTAVASVATGMLFGLLPALRWSRAQVAETIKGAAEGRIGRSLYLGKGLIALQVGLSVVLLVGAGLLGQTLLHLYQVPIRFDSSNILLGRVDPTLNGYTEARLGDLYGHALERLRATPGVEHAGLVRVPMVGGRLWSTSVTVSGYEPAEGERVRVYANLISDDFLETMRIPLLAGRPFTAQDNENSQPVAIINEEMAQRYFRDPRPLGRHFTRGRQETEVIGIVANIPYVDLRREAGPSILVPYRQYLSFLSSAYLAVRTSGPPQQMATTLRETMRSLDPNLPVFDVKTQLQQIEETLSSERRFATLSVLFGGLALLLVCVGLVGLLSYEVTRRTREIGIRMALGGQPSNVRNMILRQGLLLAGLGWALGLAAAVPLAGYLESVLFGVQAFDPVTLGASGGVMLLAATLAAWVPARRATRVDPMLALRHE